MVLTIGKVSRMFGISRTALIYYDKIGLISPESRSTKGYRLYSQADVTRLKQIMILKNAGVPINQIKSIIFTDETISFGKLMKRLGEFNLMIKELRDYQKKIISILDKTSVSSSQNINLIPLDKLLSYAEIDLDKKDQWHSIFETQSPELHKDFLSILGLTEVEIKDLKDRIK